MSKLISFVEVLARLRYEHHAIPRMTLMNWVQRGHLTDMRPDGAKGRRVPIFLDEDEVIIFAQTRGYEWLPPGQQHFADDKALIWEELQKLSLIVQKHERQVSADRDRIAALRSTVPRRSGSQTTTPPVPFASTLERALATPPSATAQRFETRIIPATAVSSSSDPSNDDENTGSTVFTGVSSETFPRWSKQNPSETEIPYVDFWVGRGTRVPPEYLSSFQPCVRAHGIGKNTAGAMRAGWHSRQQKGMEQRFQVTYIKEEGAEGQMLLTEENSVQVIQQLQKEAKDKSGKWDEETLCHDPLCLVCPTLDWNPLAHPEQAQLVTIADVLSEETAQETDESDTSTIEKEFEEVDV